MENESTSNTVTATARDMTDFGLKPQFLEKLGLNPDHTEIEKSETEDKDKSNPETEDKNKTETDSKKEQQDKSNDKSEGTEEKVAATTTQSPDDDYNGKLLETVETYYNTPEMRKQLLDDLGNHSKFWANVTQKSQSLAAEKKLFDEMCESLNYKEIKEFLSDKEFLETLDRDWFNDGKENPLHKLPEIYKQISEKQQKEAEDFDKQMDEQVDKLKSLDKKYEDFDEIIKLADFADSFNISNLVKAHELRKSNLSGEDKINEMNTTLEKLKAELQERNNELSDVRKTGIIKPIKPGASGFPPKNENYKLDEVVGFDNKLEMIKKRLKVK